MAGENQKALQRDLATLFQVGVTGGLEDRQLLEQFNSKRPEVAELAFAVLVERHGPMVLRTCRGVLHDEHDAQDCFQATFLVLMRCAPGLWVRDSLGPWLHRVALRVAIRARRAALRRRSAEQRAMELTNGSVKSVKPDELHAVLHAEIDRLPDRYRLPVVLCDLEGRTYEMAAQHLRCPVGTVKSRLARGRERLRGQLSRRGFAPVAGSLAALACADANAGATAIPEPVTQAVLRAVAARAEAAGAVPDAVGWLVNGALRSMMFSRLKWGAGTLMAVALVCGGAGRFAGWVQGAAIRPAVTIANEPARRVAGGTQADEPQEAAAGADPATEERTLAPFQEIRLVGKLRALVSNGPEQRVTVSGAAARVRSVRTSVETPPKSSVMRLTVIADDAGDDAAGAAQIADVRIVIPRLTGLIAEGAARVELRDIKQDSLELSVMQHANARAEGTSRALKATVANEASLDASALKVREANVTALGDSRCVVNASDTLNVMTSGKAQVEFLGNPQLHEVNTGGSHLRQRREDPPK